jgi:hypothetical protein
VEVSENEEVELSRKKRRGRRALSLSERLVKAAFPAFSSGRAFARRIPLSGDLANEGLLPKHC